MKCANCQAETTKGFLLDHGHFDSPDVAEWIAGPPEIAWWGGLKTSGRDVRHVQAYCCPDCGLIQLFAEREK